MSIIILYYIIYRTYIHNTITIPLYITIILFLSTLYISHNIVILTKKPVEKLNYTYQGDGPWDYDTIGGPPKGLGWVLGWTP